MRRVLKEIRGGGIMYKFIQRNRLGERIIVLIRRTKTDIGVGRDNHPKYWLSVTTMVTDRWGSTQEKYNPQTKIIKNRRILDREWVLEPSTENTQKILEQVERLAFGGQ